MQIISLYVCLLQLEIARRLYVLVCTLQFSSLLLFASFFQGAWPSSRGDNVSSKASTYIRNKISALLLSSNCIYSRIHMCVWRGATYQSSPARNINLDEITPPIPCKVGREESRLLLVSPKPPKLSVVSIKHDPVRTGFLDTDSVISEGPGRMEIEDPEKTRALEDEDLVRFILQADVCLRGVQPAILLFGQLHGAVKFVEVFVS